MLGVKEEDGALVMCSTQDDLGGSLYSFIEAILKISDVTYLTPESGPVYGQ